MAEPSFEKTASPFRAGLFCLCPACGKGKLFSGYLTLAAQCPVCGLDYGSFDSGDGPAVFIILFLGFFVVAAALIVEVRYSPPLWLHMLMWSSIVVAGVLGLLRPVKGLMLAAQYHFKAQEGRLDR